MKEIKDELHYKIKMMLSASVSSQPSLAPLLHIMKLQLLQIKTIKCVAICPYAK
jgi:hypothetical protein